MKVLFGREQISADLAWSQLAEHLPGWELACCPPNKLADNLDGVDVICPFGARIGAPIIAAGSFGLVHQFGVGLDGVDVATATELGVLSRGCQATRAATPTAALSLRCYICWHWRAG